MIHPASTFSVSFASALICVNRGNVYSELSSALEIISEFYDIVRPRDKKSADRSGKILSEKVRAYIEQNYADSIKIADIAEKTLSAKDISPIHLKQRQEWHLVNI